MTSIFEGRHIDFRRATHRSSKVDTSIIDLRKSTHRSSKIEGGNITPTIRRRILSTTALLILRSHLEQLFRSVPFCSVPFHNRSIEQFWCAFTLRLMILIRTSKWGRFPYCVMTHAVLIAFALSTCPRGWRQEYQHVCCLCYACKYMKTEEQRREREEGDWPSLPSFFPRLV